MKLADGIDFALGMTVYLPIVDTDEFRRIETSPTEHEIDTFIYEGRHYHFIVLKGSRDGTDIGFFYSSPAAIIDARIASLRRDIAGKQAEVERLEAFKKMGS